MHKKANRHRIGIQLQVVGDHGSLDVTNESPFLIKHMQEGLILNEVLVGKTKAMLTLEDLTKTWIHSAFFTTYLLPWPTR